jgi:pimeloyl-ACP methyl ester carboxylesterase
VVVGADDRLTPPSAARELAGALPDASLKVIKQAGHMLVLEQSAALSAAVEKFLNSLPIN